MKHFYTLSLSFLLVLSTVAQGIKGRVVDENGDPMPNASIYVLEAKTGTATNLDGYYQLRLEPGIYTVTYQYISYAAQQMALSVTTDFVAHNVQMKPQSVLLKTATVTDKAEDPAYTIMRKAISKAKFHLLQIDEYNATVYTKGTGQVGSIPWPFRKALEKEGVDTGRVYTSESISEVTFKRPNTFKEKIISVRASGEDDQNASPNGYFNASFYVPTVAGAVSPLSPSAFSYYRFKWLGSFIDRGVEVNKIQVTPRSKGENVFEGVIYIRENYWNIHSLDLKTTIEGFDVMIEKVHAPVEEDIWLPVTQKAAFNGSILGFGFSYFYLASVSNYKITRNPDLSPDLTIIDEKIEPVPEEVKAEEKVLAKTEVKEAVKKEDKKLTRKRLEKMMEEYEEEEWEIEEEQDIVGDYWYEVDSNAYTFDSAYWAQIRPVPLTQDEVEGYQKDDSVYVAEKLDSIQKEDGKNIGFGDLLFGNTYKLGERARFDFNGFLPEFRFNTVEGFNLDFAGRLRWKRDSLNKTGLAFEPRVRYGFSSGKVYGKLRTSFGIGQMPKRTTFSIDGGKYVQQFHPNSIDPLVNSVWSLVFARNYMKLYERYFGTIAVNQQFGYKWNASVGIHYASRNELFNRTDFSFFRPGENWYTSNAPENIETTVGGFQDDRALKTVIHVSYQPWLKFRRFNGKLIPIRDNSPVFRASLHSGWNNVLESTVDYQRIELGATAEFKLGVRATVDFDVEGGTFLNNNRVQFMDFKHFDGGLTEIAPLNVTGNYRLLDYYNFSTQSSYVSALSHIRFRKFLFTHIPLVRMSGVKENLFVNYLKTDFSPNYWEVGYTIDKIARLFRLEFVYSFHDLEPQTFGVRIGVSSLFE